MKNRIVSAILAVFSMATLNCSGDPGLASGPKKEAGLAFDFEGYAQEVLTNARGGGVALGVVKDGKLVYSKGFGHRDVENRLPVTSKTVFGIGSVTKSFTATLAGILVDRGKLKWDEPIKSVLPEFKMIHPASTEKVSLAHLLSHQCGLPRHEYVWIVNPKIKRNDVLQQVGYLEAYPEIGKRFLYNNLTYTIAGIAEERVSGESWEILIQREIFTPLHMDSSSASYAGLRSQTDHALPYSWNGDQLARTEPISALDAVGPAGSLNSNLEDMSRYAVFHLNQGRPLLSERTFKRIHTNAIQIEKDDLLSKLFFEKTFPGESVHYQFGWIESKRHGLTIQEHGGGTRGYLSELILVPKKGIAVIALTNNDRMPLSFLAYDLLDHTLGRVPAKMALGAQIEFAQKIKDASHLSKRSDLDSKVSIEEKHSMVGSYSHSGGILPFLIQERQGTLEFAFEEGRFEMVLNEKGLWTLKTDDLLLQSLNFQWDNEKRGFYLVPMVEEQGSPRAFFGKDN